jgi:hypothetical protein
VEPDYLPDSEIFSAVFIPHEVFTPHKYVHSSMRGTEHEGSGGLGAKPPKEKLPCKVYCNFIVNLDRSL